MRSQLVRHGTGSSTISPLEGSVSRVRMVSGKWLESVPATGSPSRFEGAYHRKHFGGLLCVRHGLEIHVIHRLARSFPRHGSSFVARKHVIVEPKTPVSE